MGKKVLVVGGGAAGLMAAVAAARQGGQVMVLEKMDSIGRKILITGKGRCNITNDCDTQTMIKNMSGNGAFLFSALNEYNNQDLIGFLAEWGVLTKVERGGRVFPVSDQAKDVVLAFGKALKALKVDVRVGEAVKAIVTQHGRARGVITKQDKQYDGDAVILATGGASYPGTGSSGDGYRMAQGVGHTIIPLKPSLVPLEVAEEWVKDLQGLSLKNVTASFLLNGKVLAAEFGEMLFTHYGLSGPIILSLSNQVVAALNQLKNEVSIQINLKPALTTEQLDKRIQRDFQEFARKQFKNALGGLLPAKLIGTIIDLSYIDPDKQVHQITKEERLRLGELLQKLTFSITAPRPISEAIVTAGGVHIKEINPSTMESKQIPGLYFAGEVIDIDGYTGGFNLQAAFSTGYVAGKWAADG
jgi:hypothetical protein